MTLLLLATTAVAGGALISEVLRRDRRPRHNPLLDLIIERFCRGSMPMVAVPLAAAAGIAVVAVPVGIGLQAGWASVERALRNGADSATLLGAVAATVLLKIVWAAAEELIYRGALLPAIARHTGWPVASIISSLVFALAHLERSGAATPDYATLTVLFFDGIGFAAAYQASGSLWAPTAWHAAKNLCVWLLGAGTFALAHGPLVLRYAPRSDGASALAEIAAAILAALAAVWVAVRGQAGRAKQLRFES
jgi:uncharacterized protein